MKRRGRDCGTKRTASTSRKLPDHNKDKVASGKPWRVRPRSRANTPTRLAGQHQEYMIAELRDGPCTPRPSLVIRATDTATAKHPRPPRMRTATQVARTFVWTESQKALKPAR